MILGMVLTHTWRQRSSESASPGALARPTTD
jgi:hypothetical protein